jgi:DNA-binding GntR family transcriptional regulator
MSMVNPALKYSSLSDQVYTYLRRQLNQGELLPGSTINIGEIALQLGISKTPLRDALIQLELEGFVTILPRRGVRVNLLEMGDVKNAYEAIGLIEACIVTGCIDKIKPEHIKKLKKLNNTMIADIKRDDFSTFFETNLEFHDVFVELSENKLLRKFITPIKHRLYDFPRQSYISAWEKRNCEEHEQFIVSLEQGDAKEAARILQDLHWSFSYQKDFILQFYGPEKKSTSSF